MRTRRDWLVLVASVLVLAVATTVLTSLAAPWWAWAVLVVGLFALRVVYDRRWGAASRAERLAPRRDRLTALAVFAAMCVVAGVGLWLDAPWYLFALFLVGLWVLLYVLFGHRGEQRSR
jgi:hypothetical protein